jgi:hypothetical protein
MSQRISAQDGEVVLILMSWMIRLVLRRRANNNEVELGEWILMREKATDDAALETRTPGCAR